MKKYTCEISIYNYKCGQRLLQLSTNNIDCDVILACVKPILINAFQVLQSKNKNLDDIYIEMHIDCNNQQFISLTSEESTFGDLISEIKNTVVNSVEI